MLALAPARLNPPAEEATQGAMMFDATGLDAFYGEPIGQATRRLILRRVRAAWPDLRGQRVLGYGFAVPYLRTMLGEAERVIALMPPQHGTIAWPEQPLVAMSDEEALPFPDALFDRILMVHGLESAESLRSLMRQIWRVLAPGGRLMAIAPNRTSLWAQVERSPFAQGRPFSRSQLDRLMREAMFQPERWDTALYAPPLRFRRPRGNGWESVGRRLWPAFAGVHLVEATKSLYALAPPAKGERARATLAKA
ncbi:MAG TPA: methyltransferase domain-containing protein [Rhizomicrobium sp.]|nr:methyltransferase domain-containing protein [Rhizomicrobium sp.]